MLKITKSQYNILEKKYIDKFYDNLERYIAAEFSEVGYAKRNTLMSECRASCASEKIENMDGIFSFHILSFINGVPVNNISEYQIANKRYILPGYNPEQLPIDTLESMY
ncbi:hypothetical protein MNBD_GAMMA11-2929 [hydrothermal vent metagenome]|uniref:Uncharacterized protein n=1 Tax=hydrothermal vent metagenome TaxID=652676 RepID=A0A3B0XRX4_9ZZZZ